MAWKFWYFESSKDRAWEDCLKVVSPFETVEDFWSIYNHIKSASELRTGCSYFVFKDGIKPMWEDPGNRAGGRWLVSFDKRQRHNLDNYWLEVLLCLIGEAFDEDGDDICGAVVDCRVKQDKISIWTADSTHKDAIWKIGKKIKERLALYNGAMSYESHEATATKTGSMVKPMLTL
jgi:translation initiation factor 4E